MVKRKKEQQKSGSKKQAGGGGSFCPAGGQQQPILTLSIPEKHLCRAKGGVAIPFPWRLHEMLHAVEKEGLLDHVVSWQPHGRAFLVKKPTEFTEKVLNRFFTQSKYPSFQRQLNIYGFSRFSHGKDKGSYFHDCFVRGKPHLVGGMVRQKIKGNRVRRTLTPEEEPDFYNADSPHQSVKNMTAAIPNTRRAKSPGIVSDHEDSTSHSGGSLPLCSYSSKMKSSFPTVIRASIPLPTYSLPAAAAAATTTISQPAAAAMKTVKELANTNIGVDFALFEGSKFHLLNETVAAAPCTTTTTTTTNNETVYPDMEPRPIMDNVSGYDIAAIPVASDLCFDTFADPEETPADPVASCSGTNSYSSSTIHPSPLTSTHTIMRAF